MKHDSEWYDMSVEAQAAGISLPVSINGPLMDTLTPSPYLESLGITREQRIANLLHLTRAVLNPKDEAGVQADANLLLPFMVLRGPLVREECLTLTVRVNTDAGRTRSITVSQATEAGA